MEKNYNMEEDSDAEDPLESFDVLESEKEFLLSLIATEIAPTEEIEALNGVTTSKSTENVEFYVAPAPRSTVEVYVRTHPFWSRGQHLDMCKSVEFSKVELEEFKRDVYNYSLAAGLGKNQAKVEVMRATAAWRKERGFGVGEVLDEWEEDSEGELEISALVALPALPLTSSRATTPETSRKRKRSTLEEPASQNFSSQVVEMDSTDAKRLRKLAKKERKKAERDMKKQLKKHNRSIEASERADDQSSVVSVLPKSDMTEPAVSTEPLKKKKKSKLGPTTSAYFAKPQVPDKKTRKEPTAVTNGGGDDSSSQRARKRHRVAANVGTESTASHRTDVFLQLATSIGEVELVRKDNSAAIKPPAVEQASAMKEIKPASTNLDGADDSGGPSLDANDKKPKRKRKRNHNRLPKDQASGFQGPNETESSKAKAPFESQENTKLHTKKRSATEDFVESPQGELSNEVPEQPSEVREGGEDVKIKPKRQRTRRKERPRDGESVHDQAEEFMPNDHSDKIDNLPEGENGEAKKHPVNSEAILEHENVSPESKKQRRDRGRKSEGKKKPPLEPFEPVNPKPKGVVEPLAELTNTNNKQPKKGTQERGRGRTTVPDEPFEVDVDVPSSREQSKVHHS